MASKSITGITLHVASNGDEPAQVLTFMKDKTRTVTIGRRSAQAKHSAASTTDTALFRCPVISRRHAQICFLEDGTVCVKDMNSHHGTHILKPGQIVSSPISPNDPRPLANADTITFGKSVGRDETYVRPIVAVVRLHYAPSSSPSSPAFAAPLSTISGPSPVHSSTGRYGLATRSAASDSSESEDDSDVEEIDVRPPDAVPALYNNHSPLFSPVPQMQLQMPRPSGFGLLSNYFHSSVFVPPRAFQVEARENGKGGEKEEVTKNLSNKLAPIEVSSASPSRSPSVVEIQAPTKSPEHTGTDMATRGEWASLPFSPQPAQDRESLEYEWPTIPSTPSAAEECDFWRYQHLVTPQFHPPGPLSSRSLAPASILAPLDAADERPTDLHAHSTPSGHDIHRSSPSPRESAEPEREQSPEDMQLSDDEDEPAQAQVDQESLPHVANTAQPAIDAEPQVQPETGSLHELAQGGIESRIEELKTTIAELGERMSQAQDGANVDVPQVVPHPVDDAPPSIPQPESEPESARRVPGEVEGVRRTEPMTDVQNAVQAALQELRVEQEALKARFAEAEELVKEVKALAVVQQNHAISLKRKRDELAVDDDDDDDDDRAHERRAIRPLKRRRSLAMRVASGVAKTTAIATLGAVATWSALAFS